MLKVGDKVSAKIAYEREDGGRSLQQRIGTVIYVHPKGRFFRANFKVGFERYHAETFHMVNGLPMPGEAQLIAYG